MGGGRKRPPERGTEKESKKKDGKSKKKKNKNKHLKEGGGDSAPSSSLETTATAEGQIMAQVLSTFSRLEQSRFEAFRRSTLASDAISEYVAHCLSRDPRRRRPEHQQQEHPISLEDICAPGQASEIAIVVSTLAKSYAQRLVMAAKTCQNGQMADGGTNAGANPETTPIQPQDILQALEERTAKGLDPGFFFVGDSGGVTSNLARRKEKDATKRLAALQAQEEYDAWVEEQKKKSPEIKPVEEEENKPEAVDEMDLDFDSDDDDE